MKPQVERASQTRLDEPSRGAAPVVDRPQSRPIGERLGRNNDRLLPVCLGMLAVLTGCSQPPRESAQPAAAAEYSTPVVTQDVTVRISPRCPQTTDALHFFPSGMFTDHEQSDKEARSIAGQLMEALKEPSLLCGRGPDEAYRLVVTNPVDYGSWSVRVSKVDEQYGLVAVQLKGLTGIDDRKEYQSEIRRVDRELALPEWKLVAEAVQRVGYWSMPSRIAAGYGWHDRDTWQFEGRVDGVYHPVRRKSDFGNDVAMLVRLMVKLSGLEYR